MNILACLAYVFAASFSVSQLNSEPVDQSIFEAPAQEIKHQEPVAGKKYVPVLYLNDEINNDTAGALIKEIELDNKDGAKTILLVINSPGGSVFAGLDLAKAIEDSDAKVVCLTDTISASMAYALTQSCSERIMTKRSVLMAHEIAVGVQGQPFRIRQVLKEMEALDNALIEQMCARTKLTFEQFKAKIANGSEYWMDWHEAVKIGAVDRVVRSKKEIIEELSK